VTGFSDWAKRRGFALVAIASGFGAAWLVGVALASPPSLEEPSPVAFSASEPVPEEADLSQPTPDRHPEEEEGSGPVASDPAADTTEKDAGADPFPVGEFLRPRVAFWKRVFAEWSEREFALHDSDCPQLVYDVIALPDSMETFSYAAQQYVRLRKQFLEERLRRLEGKAASGIPLEEDEKALALEIATTCGNDALRGAHARLRAQRGLRERFRRGLAASGRYLDRFREIFREAGLPEDLCYLPHVESSFDPRARSSAGAVGLWQFTRSAGRRFLTLNAAMDERWDPIAAARGAARYLGRAYELLQSWPLALTSYNHGVEGMLKARERFGDDFERILREFDGRAFGFASKNFYAEFLAAREIARDPASYFPEGIEFEPAFRADRLVLDRPIPPHRLAQRYGIELSRLAALNPAWSKRALHHGLSLPAGTVVWLPEGTLERFASKQAPPEKAQPPAGEESAAAAVAARVAETIVHVVRRGETLVRIAARYGVKVADILALNPLPDPSSLKPGQRLRIPVSP
jgi:membrane-bound lytic murein transglycosylase D